MTNNKKKLLFPIGIDDYKKLIEGNYVYVDKTLLIKEFWEEGAEVTLITRPRRFGKTISLSMLRYFFEKSEHATKHLFENSLIWQEQDLREHQGMYPVIFISFKDIKANNWKDAYQDLQALIQEEVDRTLTPVLSLLNEIEKRNYDDLMDTTITGSKLLSNFKTSLKFITKALSRIHNKKTIVLVDEYDTPITHSYMQGYYHEMIDFMSSLLSKGLKSNVHLHKGLMTGVVRTAKDGILSGLNNPNICTMLDSKFANKFGFTEQEIDNLLHLADRSFKKEEIKSWYNGYVCGSKHLSGPYALERTCSLYNPWSILKYLEGDADPETYWANTGSTELLERLISETSTTTQDELKILLEGKSLERKTINQDVILLDLNHKEVEPWSFLFFAGYVTATGHIFTNDTNYYTLTIPNKEIWELYRKLTLGAISKRFSPAKLEILLKALTTGNAIIVNDLLGDFIRSFCSFHDLSEKDLESSLHLFVLGLLVSLSNKYIVTSNLESGYGRYDIMLCPKMPNSSNEQGVILEFKKGKKKDLKELAKEALTQIKANQYATQLYHLGYVGNIFCYGIASYKKEIFIEMEVASSNEGP